MKFFSLLVVFALFTVIVAQPTSTSTATPATPTEDPIIADYMKKLTELYTKAIIDYYHAHPERLRADLSILTTAEYETLVPPDLITEFHLNRDEIASQLRANDAVAYHTAQADLNDNDMEINAIPSTTADPDDRTRAHPHQFDAQIGKEGLGLGLGLYGGGIGLGYPMLGGGLGLGLGLGYPGVLGAGFGYPLGGLGLGYGGGLGFGYGGLGYPIAGGVGLGLGWRGGLGLAVI